MSFSYDVDEGKKIAVSNNLTVKLSEDHLTNFCPFILHMER